MKKTIRMLALLTATAAALPVVAQNAPQAIVAKDSAPGQVSLAEAIQLQGTITALDKQSRIATIKGGGGNELLVVLGDNVKNIDQIAVGDLVTLTYGQALLVELRKAANKVERKRVESGDAVKAKPGSKPAAAMERTVEFVADIIAINPKAQTITVRGVKGTAELKVNDPAQLKLMKVGDQLEGVYSEAVAIAVTPQVKK